MKIAVRAGHNVYNNGTFDPGAVGNGKTEADITKAAAKRLVELLRKQGHIARDVTPYNQKFGHRKQHHVKMHRLTEQFGADLLVDLHVNSGGGTGVECWTYSLASKSNEYARAICDNIAADFEFANRGVKHNPAFWTLNQGKTPAIIVECGFIDSPKDAAKLGGNKYAEAVAKAFGAVVKEKEVAALTEKDVRAIVRDEIEKAQTGEFIPSWAEESVDFVKGKGILQGYPDGTFKPNKAVSRMELAAVIQRLYM